MHLKSNNQIPFFFSMYTGLSTIQINAKVFIIMEITNLSKKEFKRMQSDGAETSSRNVYVFKTQVVKTVAALKMAKQ